MSVQMLVLVRRQIEDKEHEVKENKKTRRKAPRQTHDAFSSGHLFIDSVDQKS